MGEYLGNISEKQTHLLDIADDLNITAGQKYPGFESFRNMLANYKGIKPFAVDALKTESKADYKRIFDMLNRTAMGIGGIGLINKSINNGQ